MNPTDDTAWGFTRYQLARALHRVRADWRAFAICVAVSFVPIAIVDLTLDDDSALIALPIIVPLDTLVALVLTQRTLKSAQDYDRISGSPWPSTSRYLSALALALVECVLIAAGFLALIIPGIALWILWSVAFPALIAEDLSPIEALKRSWALARGALGSIGVLASTSLVALLLPSAGYVWIAWNAPAMATTSLVVVNLVDALVAPFNTIAMTYAYLALRPDPA